MIAAIIFSLSAVVTVVFLALRSDLALHTRIALCLAIVSFSVFAYVFATRWNLSPFSVSGTISFGDKDQLVPICLAVVGAVTGILGSYFFHLGRRSIRWRGLAPPLVTFPIILIPTIKLVEASGEQSLLTFMLLFALSYQNGFFWERVLKPAAER
jgi:hypothetical protein